jgi:hypothetical protein
MNERDALAVTAVQAIETADRERSLWSDADRSWASRAAAGVVGEGAAPETFIGRRAVLAADRLFDRYPPMGRAVRALQWRRWVGVAVIALAFVAGVAIDRIGETQRINLLAPPVLGVLAWNVVVYVLLLASPLLRAAGAHDFADGPLRRAIVRAAGGLAGLPRRDAPGPLGAAIGSFTSDWSQRATPLYRARAARILHWAAAAIALGVIAGIYLRGLALEYRVTWESTFLDASAVHRILSVALAPGVLVTGVEVPSVEALATMRSGAMPASANAAQWLHLIAATLAIVVIVPRLLLGAFASLVEAQRRKRIAIPLSEPYFERLLRGFRGGPVRVKVVPYSYNVPPAAADGLQSIVGRTFGGSASLVIAAPVAYGEEDALPPSALPESAGPTLALFNLAATPEREAHGAFVSRLASAAKSAPVIVLVDESSFAARTTGTRLDERRAAWRSLFGERGIEPVFANLEVPDVGAVEAALEMRLGKAGN